MSTQEKNIYIKTISLTPSSLSLSLAQGNFSIVHAPLHSSFAAAFFVVPPSLLHQLSLNLSSPSFSPSHYPISPDFFLLLLFLMKENWDFHQLWISSVVRELGQVGLAQPYASYHATCELGQFGPFLMKRESKG